MQRRDPDTINEDRSKATWWSGEVTYARELHEGLTLVAGAEVQSDLRNGRRTATARSCLRATPTNAFFHATDTTRYWALYAQVDWQIAAGWDATIGVRHDHYASFGGVTDPRLALVHRPTPT